jgi:WD40 repeat protein
MLFIIAVIAVSFAWGPSIPGIVGTILWRPWYVRDLMHRQVLEPEWGYEYRLVAFSGDGHTLATEGGGPQAIAGGFAPYNPGLKGTLSLWDVQTRRLVARTKTPRDDTQFLLFSRDGTTIVALDQRARHDDGSYDWTASVWNVPELKLRNAFNLGAIRLWSAALSADGRFLAIGFGDWFEPPPNIVTLWNTTSGTRVAQSPELNGTVTAVHFAPGDRTIVAGSQQLSCVPPKPGHLWRLNAATLNPIGEPAVVSGGVRALAVADDRSKLVVGEDHGRRLSVWDMKLWVLPKRLKQPERDESVDIVDCSPRADLIATGEYKLRLWNLEKGAVDQWAERSVLIGPLKALSFGISGRVIAVASDSPRAGPRILDVVTGAEIDWEQTSVNDRHGCLVLIWAGAMLCLLAAFALRRRARDSARPTTQLDGGRAPWHRAKWVRTVGAFILLTAMTVLGWRVISSERLRRAIDHMPGGPCPQFSNDERTLLKSVARRAIYSPADAHLLELLGVDLSEDFAATNGEFEINPNRLQIESISAFADAAGRARMLYVFGRGSDHVLVVLDNAGRILEQHPTDTETINEPPVFERTADGIRIVLTSKRADGDVAVSRFLFRDSRIAEIQLMFPDELRFHPLQSIDIPINGSSTTTSAPPQAQEVGQPTGLDSAGPPR